MIGDWPQSNPDFYRITIERKEALRVENTGDVQCRFYKYALNFHEAAFLIAKYLVEDTKDIAKLDKYIFSLAYLYRHALELMLKAIGLKYIVKNEQQIKFLKDTFHNLSVILEHIKPYIKTFIREEEYKWIESLFKGMNKIDKESDSFRYPFGIRLQKIEDWFGNKEKQFSMKIVFDTEKHIDLVNFANKMEIAFDILESYYLEEDRSEKDYQEYEPSFLEEGGYYYAKSVIGYSFSRAEFYPYVDAYVECGQYLYDCMKKDKRLEKVLFIPMCYLYRNGMELALKDILFAQCGYDLQSALRLIHDKKHSFKGLWNSIKEKIIEHAGASSDDTTIEDVEKYIDQLHNVDGSSDKFRYPTDKYLNMYFSKPKRFDVGNVNTFFNELNNFLSAVCMMMSEHNEALAEMEAEWRNDMASEYSGYNEW